jgi:hypothetical protein
MENNTGLTREQIEIITDMGEEKGMKIVDVLIAGSSLWGEYGLNGHYWCEMPDGTIVDEWFDYYDQPRNMMNVKNRTLKHYPCTNPITSAVMIKKAMKLVADMGGDEVNALLFGKNQPQKCMFNAIANCYKHGGTLRFGSLGLDTDCGSVTMWIFGNEDFKTYNDFVKEDPGEKWTVRDPTKAKKYAKTLARFFVR